MQHPHALHALVHAIIAYSVRADAAAQEEAAWALAALTAEPEAADHLAHSQACLQLLLELLSDGVEAVKLQAAWGASHPRPS